MPLYFIAIVAPNDINQQVLEWKHYMQQQFNCQVALKSPAHITLVPPFSMAVAQEPELTELLDQLALQGQQFLVHCKNFDAFKPRVIFVHVQPDDRLQQLKKKVESALLQTNRFHIKKEDRPFHPHITIANRDLQKKDFNPAWQYFQHIPYEAVFEADNISLLRHNGSRWEIAKACRLPVK
jgi:2'-5' RNA ligase